MNKAPNSKAKKRLRQISLGVGIGLAAVMALIFVLFAGLYVRLTLGDVSGAWLKKVVDEQLSAGKPDGLRLDYDGLSIGLTPSGQPVARLTNLVTTAPNGLVELKAASTEIIFDLAALATGAFKVHQVSFVGGSIETILPYMENGPLQRPIPFGVAFVDTGLQLVRNGVDGLLERALLSDMRVTFSRPEWPRPVTYHTTRVTMEWAPEGLIFEGAFVGSEHSWSVSLNRTRPQEELSQSPSARGPVSLRPLSLRIVGVAPRDLAGNPRLASTRSEATAANVINGFPLDLEMDALFTEDNQVASVTMDISTGVGWVGSKTNPSAILDETRLQLSYSQGEEQLNIDKLSVIGGRTSVEAKGSFRPPWFTTSGRGEFILRANAPVLAFRADENAVKTVDVQAHGFVDLKNSEFVLTRADLITNEAALAARGRFAFGSTSPELSFAAKLRDVGLDIALALWPTFLAGDAHAWVADHFKAGHIESAEIAFRLGNPFFDDDQSTDLWSPSDIQGQFKLSDVDLKIIDTLPVVQNISAAGSVDGRSAKLVSEPVTPTLESGRPISLGAITIEATGLERNDAEITVDGRLSGEAAAVSEVVAGFLPDVVAGAGIDPEDVLGTADVATRFVFKDLAKTAGTPSSWQATGTVDGLGAAQKIQGRSFTDGDLTFLITEERAKIDGVIRLDGVVADIDVDRSLLELEKGIASGVAFTLDAETRAKLGLDLGDALAGAVNVRLVENAQARTQEGGQAFEVDLTNAAISLAQVGLDKPQGMPGLMTFILVEKDGTRLIEDLELILDRPILTASARLDENGLVSAEIAPLKLSADDDVTALVMRDGPDDSPDYRVSLSGRQFDLRPLLTASKTSRDAADDDTPSIDQPQISLGLNVARVIGHGDLSAQNVTLTARLRGDTLLSAEASATIGESGHQLIWTPDGDWRLVELQSDDIGALLRFTDTYTRLRGGVASLDGRLPLSGNEEIGSGTLFVRDFVLDDDERLRQVEAQIEEDARRHRRFNQDDGPGVGRPAQNGIAFDKLTGNFTQEGPLLRVSDLSLQGQTIGAIGSGVVNLKTRQIDFRGTFIPLYGLNNLFGRVPVLGQILGGGERGGLLGVTFRTFGPLAKPEFSINPASLLTPGIFRKVFGFEPLEN